MNYLKINDKFSAVEFFNELSHKMDYDTTYRILDSPDNQSVITNVPPEIYDSTALINYAPPTSEETGNSQYFIDFLHEGFNFFHHNFPDARLKFEDGKLFHYNDCYENSLGVYFCLQNIGKNNNIPITSPICICFGYIAKLLSPGGVIGNAVINVNGLVVHDWHVWNMINNFVIDLSITKNGGVYALSTTQLRWKQAEDHVFKNPPENISYHGIPFTDDQEFTSFTKNIFDIHNS